MVLDPLNQLVRVQEVRAKLKKDYDYWLERAIEAGYSNSKIAHELGVSETAIRAYRKRHKL